MPAARLLERDACRGRQRAATDRRDEQRWLSCQRCILGAGRTAATSDLGAGRVAALSGNHALRHTAFSGSHAFDPRGTVDSAALGCVDADNSARQRCDAWRGGLSRG